MRQAAPTAVPHSPEERDAAETVAQGFDGHGDVVASALRVFTLESEGIAALKAALEGDFGDAFRRAIDIIRGATGRLVVTGMGKSGHIGRKIAATMASVGTPAYFVHPGEASHGDMGMIRPDDVVLALSYSGETTELNDIIGYCSRFGIDLIGITGDPESALAEASTVALTMPRSVEACPLGLAPTTSMAMALALGDALAVALLERRGFSADDFQVLHPGGKLGRRLTRVADIMHTGEAMPLVGPDDRMAEVLIVMTARRLGCAGVVGPAGDLVGIVTDGDLRRHMDAGLVSREASGVMTPDPVTIRPEALAAEALGLMNAREITGLFVVRNGKPVGFVHLHDCLREGVA